MHARVAWGLSYQALSVSNTIFFLFIYLSDRHHFEINHYGSPRTIEGHESFKERDMNFVE